MKCQKCSFDLEEQQSSYCVDPALWTFQLFHSICFLFILIASFSIIKSLSHFMTV